MFVHPYEFFLIALAVFRLTRLIVYDQITVWLRKPFHLVRDEELEDGTVVSYLEIKGTGIKYWIGELLSCHWCVAIWSAVVLICGYMWFPTILTPVVIILAAAAVASLMEVIVDRLSNG
ncbi:DUF1360 domain-containing protein [Desertibacillus haloalkaliphilus]|uniref:DUF1360 domain-containing protein n=1 Tax=Desertibacillus haloalkaliphilus TaxID=1328930 RepID=UPI001C279DFB|nr:DUF1360 domain-containing protein [Desertibacillus haloalkaliphilus]MBU8906894.1 DUF1360 domain-containing protein [Desertibacillus haloalkaliphilus]